MGGEGEDESCESCDGIGGGFGEEEACSNGEFGFVLFGESLEGGGYVEEILVVIGGDEYGGYLLFEIIFDELYYNFHGFLLQHKYSYNSYINSTLI